MAISQVIGNFLKVAAKKINWKDVFATVAPWVWQKAKEKMGELRERVGNDSPLDKKGTDVDKLNQRVTQLEQLVLEFGKLFPELEKEQNLMSEVIQTLSARVIVLSIATGSSIVISIIALILTLIK